MRHFRLDRAFLPHQVTAAIGLPLHVAYAQLHVVAPVKREAIRMIEPLRLRLGRSRCALTLVTGNDVDWLDTAGLTSRPTIYAHSGLDSHAPDRFLVELRPDLRVIRVCSMRDLHLAVDPVTPRR